MKIAKWKWKQVSINYIGTLCKLEKVSLLRCKFGWGGVGYLISEKKSFSLSSYKA